MENPKRVIYDQVCGDADPSQDEDKEETIKQRLSQLPVVESTILARHADAGLV